MSMAVYSRCLLNQYYGATDPMLLRAPSIDQEVIPDEINQPER